MMRIFILLAVLFLMPLKAKAQESTIPYLDGVPVMRGFTVMEESILLFDKPEGQIAEVSLFCETGCPQKEAVYTYYNDVLKGLGWASDGANHFFSESKYIRIEYSKADDLTSSVILTFHLKG